MTQEEALTLVDAFLKAHGLVGSDEQDDAVAEAESAEGKNEEPRPGILDAIREEASDDRNEMGGGVVEYDPADKGLYLKRSYSDPVSVSQLSVDLQRLQQASIVWGEEVLDRVASKVFHPEELKP